MLKLLGWCCICSSWCCYGDVLTVVVVLQVERPVTFSVQMNGALGDLRAYVDTPSGTQEDVFITELDEDKNSLRSGTAHLVIRLRSV